MLVRSRGSKALRAGSPGEDAFSSDQPDWPDGGLRCRAATRSRAPPEANEIETAAPVSAELPYRGARARAQVAVSRGAPIARSEVR